MEAPRIGPDQRLLPGWRDSLGNNQRRFARREHVTDSAKELAACTKEQLEHLLAGLLEQAHGQTLNDAEVQEFWRVYEEIQQRSKTAA
jgi:hypothetical protein